MTNMLFVSNSLNCLQIIDNSPSRIEIVSILIDFLMSMGWLAPIEDFLAGSGDDIPLDLAKGDDSSEAWYMSMLLLSVKKKNNAMTAMK